MSRMGRKDQIAQGPVGAEGNQWKKGGDERSKWEENGSEKE